MAFLVMVVGKGKKDCHSMACRGWKHYSTQGFDYHFRLSHQDGKQGLHPHRYREIPFVEFGQTCSSKILHSINRHAWNRHESSISGVPGRCRLLFEQVIPVPDMAAFLRERQPVDRPIPSSTASLLYESGIHGQHTDVLYVLRMDLRKRADPPILLPTASLLHELETASLAEAPTQQDPQIPSSTRKSNQLSPPEGGVLHGRFFDDNKDDYSRKYP